MTVNCTRSVEVGGPQFGDLTITAAGNITMGSLNMTNLTDITFFSVAQERVVIDGPLLNFDTNSPSTEFASVNCDVCYNSFDTNNTYLLEGGANGWYVLDGTHVLRPCPRAGTVIIVR